MFKFMLTFLADLSMWVLGFCAARLPDEPLPETMGIPQPKDQPGTWDNPKMQINPLFAKVWDYLTEEQKIRAVIFADVEMPIVRGKIYFIRYPWFWVDC